MAAVLAPPSVISRDEPKNALKLDFSALRGAPPSPPLTPPSELVSSIEHQSEGIDTCQPVFIQNTTVAVIGVGYVGLHLVEAFSAAYNVIAFDISPRRVKEVQQKLHQQNVYCTSDPRFLSQATHVLIAVSTVVDYQKSIDTSCIESAIRMVQQHARPGTTIVIESSVAVGMTRDLLQPLMNSKSLLCGMSPERVDPGRTYPHYTEIPKIVAGLNAESLESIKDLYSRVFADLVPVSSTEVAEMTKLYENCQRMMCIAYANEMADACQQLSERLSTKATRASKHDTATTITIDPWEVSRAAATKPFGYMPYTPSLGVGGHCIPVNPYYLLSNSDFPLLKACTERMADRPSQIGDRVMTKVQLSSKAQRHNILVVGLGFKKGQSVLSNSPGKALAFHLLSQYEVYVEFADPLVSEDAVPLPRLDDKNDWHLAYMRRFDAIVVAVEQVGLDMQVLKDARDHGLYVEWFCRHSELLK